MPVMQSRGPPTPQFSTQLSKCASWSVKDKSAQRAPRTVTCIISDAFVHKVLTTFKKSTRASMPRMRQIPPQMRQMPPKMRQMPPQMRQMPPKMRQIPPKMRQMPPQRREICTMCMISTASLTHSSFPKVLIRQTLPTKLVKKQNISRQSQSKESIRIQTAMSFTLSRKTGSILPTTTAGMQRSVTTSMITTHTTVHSMSTPRIMI